MYKQALIEEYEMEILANAQMYKEAALSNNTKTLLDFAVPSALGATAGGLVFNRTLDSLIENDKVPEEEKEQLRRMRKKFITTGMISGGLTGTLPGMAAHYRRYKKHTLDEASKI